MAGESARAAASRHRSKAQTLMRMGEAYERGALGEESTARALATLPELDWRVFHDVHWPGRRYANIDHVVVGPGGVFVIDSKAWSGKIEVAEGVLRQNGRRRERHVLAALDAAAAVAELLPGLDPSTVKPVLCFDRDQPVFGWSHEVLVCSTVNVATLLSSRPRILHPATLHATAQNLAQSLKAATDPIVPIPPKRQVPKERRRANVPRRRENLTRSLVSVLAASLFALLAIEMGPELSSVVQDQARDRIDPSLALGETATVKGNPVRPELRLLVDRVRPTRAVNAKPGSTAPVQLLAATVTIHNVGREAWTSNDGTKFVLLDEGDFSHPRSTGAKQVRAGRRLPTLVKLKPGQAKRGIVVFGVPRGVRAASVRITVGPGYPKTFRWSVG